MLDILLLLKDIFFFAAYVSSGSSFPDPLSPEEEREAVAAMKRGDEFARAKLISHNLRLVAHVAKKFATPETDMDDLISIGTIGLIKAISTFDLEKGAALATYAARCIQNEVLMSLRAGKKRKKEVSLNATIGTDNEGNEITLVDIMGTGAGMVPDEVERRIDVSRMRKAVESCLSPRERVVITMRYGLSEGPCLPQREVAEMLGISRSYVSRIEKKALNRLFEAMKN